jgi:hypothetical protein
MPIAILASHRLTRVQSLADTGNLVLQERIILLVVDPDRTAENHKKIAGLRLRQGKMRRGDFNELDVKASFPKRRFQRTKILKS